MTIIAHHFDDSEGRPAGGCTYGRGFAISWQHGPLVKEGIREDPNGAFVESVIEAAIDRLAYYQGGQFACDYNKRAIGFLDQALLELRRRTSDREKRMVEGTHDT